MKAQLNFSAVFPQIPHDIRIRIEAAYSEILSNYLENRFEPSELNGAKFAESVFRLLEWHTTPTHSYTPFGHSIKNFSDSIRKLENLASFPDSVRFHIPILISSIYTIRNKRGVGHMGGDINPNKMDATLIVNISKWVLSELVRLFHSISLSDAQTIVENLTVKEYPVVWDIFDKKRVLNNKLNYNEKTLVLLYSIYPNPALEPKLVYWLEYSNPTAFRKHVLVPLHKERMIEYDSISKYIVLSPKGVKFVEENIDLDI